MKTNIETPLVSCILLTYNQEEFIHDSLRGLFSQDYSNIEYIISDDFSQDGTWSIISNYIVNNKIESKNLILNRNEKNNGIVKHLKKVISMAKGEIIVLMAGDDISFDSRVREIVEAFTNNNVSMVFSDALIINKEGEKKGNLFVNKKNPRTIEDIISKGFVGISGAGMACKKEVYSKFGEIPTNIDNEDDHLPFRAALLDGMYIINKPLLYYRMHEKSLSSWLWREQSFESYFNKYVNNITNRINHYHEWKKLIIKSNLSTEEKDKYCKMIALKVSELDKKIKSKDKLFFKFNIYLLMKFIQLKTFIKKTINKKV